MSFYICFAPPNGCLSKKSYPCLRGIAGIKRNTHHHKCLITSYSITVCLVLRCTGGFCYSPHSNRQGGWKWCYPKNTGKVSNAGFTHFIKPYCTMKPVIITGNENAEHNAKYPLNTCKRMLLLRRTAQTNTLSCRTSRLPLKSTDRRLLLTAKSWQKPCCAYQNGVGTLSSCAIICN